MSPKTKKTKASAASSSSAWVAVAETFNCKKVSSVSSPQPAKNGSLNSVHNAHNQGYSTKSFSSGSDLEGVGKSQRDQDLLLTISELRHELEFLKSVLEERERADAAKDSLIERLTNTVQMLQNSSATTNVSYQNSSDNRYRSSIPEHKSAEFFRGSPLVANGIDYDDDDLV